MNKNGWKIWFALGICLIGYGIISLFKKEYLLGIIFIITGAINIISSRSANENDKELEKIKLSNIDSKEIDKELKSLITKGKKIQAIKLYREVTGLGLKESKEYVDSLE
ncbi:MAG: DNA-binding protein [Clostridiales bacterium]|nr:DNA-binding protein [Clostridiales bacterium]